VNDTNASKILRRNKTSKNMQCVFPYFIGKLNIMAAERIIRQFRASDRLFELGM
jgi:hypothetical protein